MTRSDSPPSPAAAPAPGNTIHPVDRLYRALAGDKLLALVAALVLVALLASLLLPQLPADRSQPADAARWLAETSLQFDSLGPLMAGAGLFNLWHSIWFQALVGLLGFVLLLRLGLAIGDASRRLRDPDPQAAAAEAALWPLHATAQLDQDTAQAGLHEDLTNEGWWVVSSDSGDNTLMVAERSRAGVLAPVLVIGGLLIVVAGLWLGQLAGWQESGITLAPGDTVALSNRPDSMLSANLDADGVLAGVSISHATGAADTIAFSAGGAARADGVTIRRRAQGPALAVSASGPGGEALQLQRMEIQATTAPSLTLVFDQPRSEQVFLLPDRQLVISIVSFPALPERGFAGPTFLVQAFRAGQRDPVLNEFVEGNASMGVGEDTLRLRTGQFITVDVRYDPTRPLIWLGAAMAALGIVLALWRPGGRLFLSVQRGRAHLAVQASLAPSWSWRAASRWLVAWTATYDQQENQSS
ncbi:MAG: cytochrome c biogenesis protein ResB [Caldilineales bacterium]